MCTTPGAIEREEEQKQIYDELKTMKGYEFYQHSLLLDPSLQMSELNRDVLRLKATTDIKQEEINQLIENAPPEPDFKVLSEEQIKELGHWDKKRYKDKVELYKQTRTEWAQSTEGHTYREITENVEKRAERRALRDSQFKERVAEAAAKKDMREGKTDQPLYADVKSTPEAMEEALEKMSDDRNAHTERTLGRQELNMALTAIDDIWHYTSHSPFARSRRVTAIAGLQAFVNNAYPMVNQYLREHKINPGFPDFGGIGYEKLCPTLVNLFRYARISRDVVVRRGTNGLDSVRHMLGGGANLGLSPAELAEQMRAKLDAGEDVILSDKGVVSTSFRKNAGKPAGPGVRPDNAGTPGVEFIILVKKGTHALNVAGYGLFGQQDKDEELMIAPGTKYRVVRAFFNDGKDEVKEGDGQDAGKVHMGAAGSWKIYLETIPESGPQPDGDDGI